MTPKHMPSCSCEPCVQRRRAQQAQRSIPFSRGGFVIHSRGECVSTCAQWDCLEGRGCAVFTR